MRNTCEGKEAVGASGCFYLRQVCLYHSGTTKRGGGGGRRSPYLLSGRRRRCPRCRAVTAGWSCRRRSDRCTPHRTPVSAAAVLYSTEPGNTETGKKKEQGNVNREFIEELKVPEGSGGHTFGTATVSLSASRFMTEEENISPEIVCFKPPKNGKEEKGRREKIKTHMIFVTAMIFECSYVIKVKKRKEKKEVEGNK